MPILSYIQRMNQLYGSEQLVAGRPSGAYGIQDTYTAPDDTPIPNWRDLIREEGVEVGPQVKAPAYNTRKYFKPGGLVEPGVTHYAITPSAERMKWLDEAAQKYGYESYNSIPNTERALKGNIARDATRRQEGVPEGKGAPGKPKSETHKAKIKETHWSKKKDIKKITHSPKKIEYWTGKVKNQMAILEQVESGILDSKQIAKNLKLSHKEVIDDSEKLFRNIYEQRMKVNKGQKVTSVFLPKTRDGLKGLLNDLWKVEGFETPEGRNWFKLIRDARESGKITIDQFKKANMNVTNFFKMKNEIQLKYPKLILNLDHPLSYGALESLGAKGEKFLTGIPTTERFNKGIKQRLDNKYASIASDVRQGVSGAARQKIAIEELAKSLNIDIGEISPTGKKIVSLGKKDIVSGKTPLGRGIIESLQEQTELAKKIGKVDPKLAEAAGMKGYFKRVNLNKVSKNELKGVAKILSDNGFTCKLAKGLTCNDPRAYIKSINEQKALSLAGDANAAAKFNKVSKAANAARGISKFTLWGILGEVAFAPVIALPMLAKGESWSRIMNDISWGAFGESEQEELARVAGTPGAQQMKALETGERAQKLQEKTFPGARIGMDPKRFDLSQYQVKEEAEQDFRAAMKPFMVNGVFDVEAFSKAGGDVEAARAQIAKDKLARKESSIFFQDKLDPTEAMVGFDAGGKVDYDNYLPGIDDDN